MQPTRIPTARAYSLDDVPKVVRGARGMRAVIDFAPKPTSTERLVAGVVTRLDNSHVSYTCAIDQQRIRHAFGESGATFYAIAQQLCESLADYWKHNPDAAAWQPPFSNASLADLSRFSAATATEGQLSMLGRTSAWHTLLQSYEMPQTGQPQGVVARVKSAISKDPNNKYLARRFGRELSLGDQAQPLKVDFLGQNLACYFLQITQSARGLDGNADRAFARLYELQALRKFVKKPRKSLGLLDDERPESFELMMVGNRNDSIQRRAIYQVEALADKGQVIARAVPTVAAAAEHLADKERMAA